MGKQIHKLLSKDTDSQTGVCAHCGKTEIRLKWGGIWRCAGSIRQHRGDGGSGEGRIGKHGLTYGEAKKLKAGKSCAICGSETKLVIDHCHATNVVRGVLCGTCNSGIGHLKEDPLIMLNAIKYLANWRETAKCRS